ncbi:hypothetical protein [Streptoalloteichus tenebrarius]|nr:hypothetical protein [Streptoalloteichus tenebrarius]
MSRLLYHLSYTATGDTGVSPKNETRYPLCEHRVPFVEPQYGIEP